MMAHLTEEQLNDYVDGALAAEERERAERHLARCAACSAVVKHLRALLARAGALPASVEPPGDLWPEIAARRAPGAAPSALPDERAPRGTLPLRAWRRSAVWTSRGALAAAALVLVTLSSAVTAVLVRRDGPVPSGPSAAERERSDAGAAAFVMAEADYQRAADQLQATLAARRDRLSPETVAAVERSLATIDRAIREAREALAQDPGNQTLVDILSASYEQKVDLLRRAAELLPRS